MITNGHEQATHASGLFGSVRRVAETTLETLRNRIELFAVELEEEKHWLVSTLLLAAASIFFGSIAVLVITALVVLLFPESARPWVLAAFCLFYLGLAVAAGQGLRKKLHHKTPPLSGTVGEIKKDIEWIRNQQ